MPPLSHCEVQSLSEKNKDDKLKWKAKRRLLRCNWPSWPLAEEVISPLTSAAAPFVLSSSLRRKRQTETLPPRDKKKKKKSFRPFGKSRLRANTWIKGRMSAFWWMAQSEMSDASVRRLYSRRSLGRAPNGGVHNALCCPFKARPWRRW